MSTACSFFLTYGIGIPCGEETRWPGWICLGGNCCICWEYCNCWLWITGIPTLAERNSMPKLLWCHWNKWLPTGDRRQCKLQRLPTVRAESPSRLIQTTHHLKQKVILLWVICGFFFTEYTVIFSLCVSCRYFTGTCPKVNQCTASKFTFPSWQLFSF